MNFTNSFYEDGEIMMKTMTTLTRTLERWINMAETGWNRG